MSVTDSLRRLLQDPPPEFAFEIDANGIAMSRTRPPAAVQYVALADGVLSPSPVKDNVLDPVAFAAAVRRLTPAGASRSRRSCALLLPDNSLRVAVLDFETLPEKEEERRALIRFRLRKTLPFDVDEAAFSFHVQSPGRVVAAVAPAELIVRYEAAFRAAGLHPGFVTASSLALLELMPSAGSVLVAKKTPGALTVMAVSDGALVLSRTLELSAHLTDPLEEISEDLYPTLVYVEDQTGARPEKLILAGFGEDSVTSATRLSVELEIPAEALPDPHPGLAGYLKALGAAPATSRGKVAA